VGRLQQSIALLPKNCFEQSPDRSTSDAPITRAPTLRDFNLLRCLGTGGYAEVWLAPYISLYLPTSPLHLPCISPISPLHPRGVARVEALYRRRLCDQGAPHPNPNLNPNPNPNPNPDPNQALKRTARVAVGGEVLSAQYPPTLSLFLPLPLSRTLTLPLILPLTLTLPLTLARYGARRSRRAAR